MVAAEFCWQACVSGDPQDLVSPRKCVFPGYQQHQSGILLVQLGIDVVRGCHGGVSG